MFQRRWVGEFVTVLRRVRVCHTHSCVHGTHVYTVMSHATRMYESRHIYVRVMSHTLMCSRHPCIYMGADSLIMSYQWVHLLMRHATRMYECRHIYVRVMIHVRKSRITHIHESCHTHSEVMPRTCASPVTYMRELWYTYERVMLQTHTYVPHAFTCVTWRIRVCAMPHAYVCHDSCMRATWLMNVCDMTHECVWHDPWMCDMTHRFVWHDWCMCVTWLIHVCDRTHAYLCHALLIVCHDSCMCVHVRDVTHGSHVNDKSWLTHKWHLCVSHDKKGLTHKWRGPLHHSSQINVTHRLCVQTRHLWVIIMKKCVYVCLHSSLMCNNNLSFMSSNNK